MLRLFRRRADREHYSARERLIYRYHDGQQWIDADPRVLHERIDAHGAALYAEMEIARFPQYHAAPLAHASLQARIRGIFDLRPLEEGGLNEVECAQLLDHFLTFRGYLRKRYQVDADSVGANIGLYAVFLGRRPTYPEYLGMIFNRDRAKHRATDVVAKGVGIGMGFLDPGPAYHAAQTDNQNAAKVLEAQAQAAKGR